MRKGNVMLMIPSEADICDMAVMEHIANETKKLLAEGMSDLVEFGSGTDYEVKVMMMFARKAVN